jgi:hypothetical protein
MKAASHIWVEALINYTGAAKEKPLVIGNEHPNCPTDSRIVPIVDARARIDPPSLDCEGFALMRCPTAVTDFRDADEVARVYPGEIERFILELTGADAVVVSVSAMLRFGERSYEANAPGTARAARLVHSDVTHRSAAEFARLAVPTNSRPVRRVAQHNIWRTFSSAPQDVPLALCDARTVASTDLIPADFLSDEHTPLRFSFEIVLVHFNPAHRWFFFSDMGRDEAIVFKRHDTDQSAPSFVPHTAFTDPRVPLGIEPRSSVEIRTIAYWYE